MIYKYNWKHFLLVCWIWIVIVLVLNFWLKDDSWLRGGLQGATAVVIVHIISDFGFWRSEWYFSKKRTEIVAGRKVICEGPAYVGGYGYGWLYLFEGFLEFHPRKTQHKTFSVFLHQEQICDISAKRNDLILKKQSQYLRFNVQESRKWQATLLEEIKKGEVV